MTRYLWWLALPALLIATAGPASAADLRDKANLFSPEAVKKAQADLDRIGKEYAVPIAIETVDSLEGRSIDDVLPQHAELAGIKGLYILISKKEHKIEVESDRSYSKYLTTRRDLGIREVFTREFKGGNFDAGLLKGVDKIDSTFSEAKAEAGGSLRPATNAPARRNKQAQAPIPAGREVPGKPSIGGMGLLITIGLGLLALFIVIRILGSLFGGGNRGYANNQRMMGPGGGGMGGPGYGGGGGGGGGGFMSSMFGGIGGALAGNWLYDQFSGRNHESSMNSTNYDPNAGASTPQDTGPDYVGPNDGGADWGGGAADAGGGGDWGGGNADAGGGGDWGGGGGGGDWGGGGGGGDDGGSL